MELFLIVNIKQEEIKIPHTTVPHRVPGRMFCLPHKDEGLIKVGELNKESLKEKLLQETKKDLFIKCNKVNGIINQMD